MTPITPPDSRAPEATRSPIPAVDGRAGQGDGPPPESRSTEAFLDRLRHAPPPDESPETPVIPGLTILERVGRGGMGIVYRAREDATGEDVAVKVLWGLGGISASAQARAHRESEILARLNHPNIVRVLSSGVCPGPQLGGEPVPFLVMEWISGGTLERFVGPWRLGPREAARLIRDVASAVAEVHALGVIHRDIKPANVLLGSPVYPGDLPVPKLADFGLARHEQGSTCLTREGAVIGTPGYLAPEQAGLDPALGTVGPATDVHGLGATLYFLLAGRPPHEGRSFVESLARAIHGTINWSAASLVGLPADLRTILEKCLERAPGRRYASARELAEDLDAYLEHRPIRARRCGPLERLGKWARRHPALAASGAVLTLSLAVMAGAAVFHVGRVASADRATAESRTLAREMVARLTGERVEQLLAGGKALDEQGRTFLVEARETFLHWPLDGDVREALLFRARGLQSVARVMAKLDRIDDAAECFTASRAPFDELARRALDNGATRMALFKGLLEEYRFLIESGRPTEAEPLIARALALIDEPLDPPQSPSDRGTILIDQGFMLAALGRHDESAAVMAGALQSLRQAVVDHPDEPEIAVDEQSALYNAAICSGNAGRREEHLARLRTLVARTEEAAGRFPDRGETFRHSRLQALAMLASVSFSAGLTEECLATSRQVGREARAALASHPGDPFLRGKVIEAAIGESRAATVLGCPHDADASIGEAVRLAEEFVASEPAVFFHVQRLVSTLREQGAHLAAVGRPDDALAAYERLRGALAPWKDSEARHEFVSAWLAISYAEAAGILRGRGDLAGAADCFEKGVAVALSPQRGQLLLGLADCSAACGEFERARRAAAEAMAEPGSVDAARAILARIDR